MRKTRTAKRVTSVLNTRSLRSVAGGEGGIVDRDTLDSDIGGLGSNVATPAR